MTLTQKNQTIMKTKQLATGYNKKDKQQRNRRTANHNPSQNDSLCVLCKGARMLCGKTRCPIMVKVNYFLKSVPLMSTEDIDGMSPPSVFIGRIGYPNVYAGPLVPPVHEDTAVYDLPERWFGKSMDEIVGFRSLLVRGKHRVNVHKFNDSGKIMEQTRDLALADYLRRH